MTGICVVVPTLGRPSLTALLTALAAAEPAPVPVEFLVVDDRPDPGQQLALPPGIDVKVVTGRAAGPAAARNVGWRVTAQEWVAFLDDDVLPDADWLTRLAADVMVAGATVGGVQGTLRVPLPADRRPTDWERVTAALADGAWITADMAYRRTALVATGGFDERLPRAFREDAELAHRVRQAGFDLVKGARTVTHPVRPEDRWISVRTQRGNADDALLRRLYGPRWRSLLEIPPGRRRRHAAVTAAGVLAVALAGAAVLTRNRSAAVAAAVAAGAWTAGTAEFAAARIAPGPGTRSEVTTMIATSAAIPPVAVGHWLRGWLRWRAARPVEPAR
ncbi:glycosyltransferase family 2 protein [Actinoplanes sp. N902-109]|uniref:glycosyltransferase family 2 protein n=1 Tax=Actinoplanes sp. (strain N902-109) TaxID=649831 RepID=UPI0003293441|nr:glycosyltransferase [Actinoplanes sp. N902-109]AGL18108.1 hydrolase, HAD-superfamily, subfamily IIIA [Actinoplanes sp. N902-109]